MDWTPFYVTFAVLVLALWVVPAGIELALFQFRCWRVRRELEGRTLDITGTVRRLAKSWRAVLARVGCRLRDAHLLPASHDVQGVPAGAHARAVSRLSARDRRLDDYNDAA
jgi:hypothetical protein